MENNQDKKKIGVIGSKEFTLGFELAGVQETFPTKSTEEYREKITQIIKEKQEEIGILVANKEDVAELPKRIQNNVNQSVDPVTVILSEDGESQHLQEKIKKAIGADISK